MKNKPAREVCQRLLIYENKEEKSSPCPGGSDFAPQNKEDKEMGLIKGIVAAAGSGMADQWREYFYCDSLEMDVLVTKGKKRTNRRSAGNNKGEENIISNGSVVAVNEGREPQWETIEYELIERDSVCEPKE